MADSYDELAKQQAEHKFYLKLATIIGVSAVLIFWQMAACTRADQAMWEAQVEALRLREERDNAR